MSKKETYRTGIGGTPTTIINNRRKAEAVIKEAEKATKANEKRKK